MAANVARFGNDERVGTVGRAAAASPDAQCGGAAPRHSRARRLARGVMAAGGVLSLLVFTTIDALSGRYDA
jgi:hypothetical protein